MDASTLHPWRVIRGLVVEQSSYDVPRIVDAAGLRVDWALTEKQDYSDKMRIAAYRPRIDEAYGALSEEDRLRVSYVITRELVRRGLAEQLVEALQQIGWRIEGDRLVPDTAPVRELFFPPQAQHDAYVQIRGILQASSSSLLVVDPYVDQTILTLLASIAKNGLVIRILTSKFPPDFAQEAKAWLAQHTTLSLEVHGTKEFHDRFVVVDGKSCWHVGCSLKDAGRRAFMLSSIDDETNRVSLLAQIETSWRAGAKVV